MFPVLWLCSLGVGLTTFGEWHCSVLDVLGWTVGVSVTLTLAVHDMTGGSQGKVKGKNSCPGDSRVMLHACTLPRSSSTSQAPLTFTPTSNLHGSMRAVLCASRLFHCAASHHRDPHLRCLLLLLTPLFTLITHSLPLSRCECCLNSPRVDDS